MGSHSRLRVAPTRAPWSRNLARCAPFAFTLHRLRFEWDSHKAALNRRKHGVSFEEALTAFLDSQARVFDDSSSDPHEPRFLLVGMSARRRTLPVVHVERAECLRIIGARLATRRERASLEEED